jgi:hypothetical protein
VPRRVSLPGADELFRPTRVDGPRPEGEPGHDQAGRAEPDHDQAGHDQRERPDAGAADTQPARARRTQPSGRVRHDEKITIYVTADELLALEHTRLRLRAQHGLAVDRGRIVREAIHLALQDVAEHGDASALVRRLREQ